MTLRNHDKQSTAIEQELSSRDTVRLAKFRRFVEEIDIYLSKKENEKLSEDWFYCISHSYLGCTQIGCIAVACGRGNSQSPYVKLVAELLFPVREYRYTGYNTSRGKLLSFNAQISMKQYNWPDTLSYQTWKEDGYYFGCLQEFYWGWRDDIEYDRKNPNILYYNIDGFLSNCTEYTTKEHIELTKYRTIFWNLFMVSLDDDIYNEQMPNVADLAFIFGFDEHMMRDWCRAVEYVLAGNRLSETCDLHCDTVEGAKFFLHSEDEDEKQRRLESEQVLELLQ